jgi:hypothetical protein
MNVRRSALHRIARWHRPGRVGASHDTRDSTRFRADSRRRRSRPAAVPEDDFKRTALPPGRATHSKRNRATWVFESTPTSLPSTRSATSARSPTGWRQLPQAVDRPAHLDRGRRRRRPRDLRASALAGPLAGPGQAQRQRRHLPRADRRRCAERGQLDPDPPARTGHPVEQRLGQQRRQGDADEEFQSLVSEVNRIGRSTEFNGIKLLDGSSSSVSFQVGFGTTTASTRCRSACRPR